MQNKRRGPWANVQRLGLWLVSQGYGTGVRLRNICYDQGWKKAQRANIPVISVGNLTVGGTGKTPCVEYIARWLRQHDVRVTVLSRGYGSKEGSNDEALMLEENLPDVPHLQGVDRVELARIAEDELESEALLLDDGFQHRCLARQLDIVLIDATNPWGYGYLLPRGLLREPLSGLKRAELVIVTRCDQIAELALTAIHERVEKIAPDLAVLEAEHRPVTLTNAEQESEALPVLQEHPIAGFCGIGNPEAFRNTLIGLGAEMEAFRTFPDHYNYQRNDIEDLRTWARQQSKKCLLITTQKDLVKIRLARLGDRPLWALSIGLHVRRGHDILDRKLKEVLA